MVKMVAIGLKLYRAVEKEGGREINKPCPGPVVPPNLAITIRTFDFTCVTTRKEKNTML